MKRVGGLLMIAIVLTLGCRQKPDCLLSDDQLVGLLLDQTLAHTNLVDRTQETRDSLESVYLRQILQYHNVSADQWKVCEENLLQDLERYQSLQLIVVDSMERLYEHYQ